METNRILSFGKYKGQEIKYVILTHIGYIMWCLENLKWFKLINEEQVLYDSIATMIKKYNLSTTFPVELMYKHVRDVKALETLETPFICINEVTSFRRSDINNPICQSVLKYVQVGNNPDYFMDLIKEGVKEIINEAIYIQYCRDQDRINNWNDLN